MKYLTAEMKHEALEKWREILRHIHARVEISYRGLYWHPCPVCIAAAQRSEQVSDGLYAHWTQRVSRAYRQCYVCPLNANDLSGIPVCDDRFHVKSYAQVALYEAKNQRWAEAEMACEKVLRALKNLRVEEEER